MFRIFQSLFRPIVPYKKHFVMERGEMDPIIKTNRNTLKQIPDWIDDKAFENACFQYGVPDYIRDDINKDLNDEPTYTDLMTLLAKRHLKELRYLEIGVSVGKNFFQMLNAIPSGIFTGFDIEEINPVLEKGLHPLSDRSWSTFPGSIKKTDSSLKTYTYNGNTVNYLCGDVWDKESWSVLKGSKFNLIFSDALHSAEAILFEFEMLVHNDLLADQFIIFWDDLHGKMKRAFLNIVRKYNKNYHIEDVFLIQINGWIGQHEAKHPVGIISNFSL